MPLAPIVVAPLLEAAGVLQPYPTLYAMPDHPRLGEFRERFAGMLGTFEIHPDEGEDDSPGFEGSRKVVGGFSIYEKLAEHPKHKVDATEYLKARLMDAFVHDYDRHSDQWRWAMFEIDGKKRWKPTPKDRDRAFSRFDGFVPSVLVLAVPQYCHFEKEISPALDLTWSGRFVDRRFLSELSRAQWDSVVAFVQARMTDETIRDAVKRLPPEAYDLVGEELAETLIARRDGLPAFAAEFYLLVNEIVEIYGTEEEDLLVIERLDDDRTEATMWRWDEDDDRPKGEPRFHRTFSNDTTFEIRAFMLDDDDKIVLRGEADRGPDVKVVGGDGGDLFIDSSRVNGWLFSVLPIPWAEEKTRIYDDGGKTEIVFGPGTYVDRSEYPEAETDIEKYEPVQLQRGSDMLVNPILEFHPDKGVHFGGGPSFYYYNFRRFPYESRLRFLASYATELDAFNLSFNGKFNNWIEGATVEIGVERTGLDLANYHGFGNETAYDEDVRERGLYRVERQLLDASAAVEFEILRNTSVRVGVSYYDSHTEAKDNPLPALYREGLYGTGRFISAAARARIAYDTRDDEDFAYEGAYLELTRDYRPKLLDLEEAYGGAGFDARVYHSWLLPNRLTLALRAAGERMWGRSPFYDAAFLGGRYDLRGYSPERFAGDASLVGQLEARLELTRLKFLVYGDFGVHGFAETGRVFADHEESDLWHPSYGGGAWMVFLDRLFTVSGTVGVSEERVAFYFRTKLSF